MVSNVEKICSYKILCLQLDCDFKSESNDEYCVVSKKNDDNIVL